MKKNYGLAIACSLIFSSMQAQITINSSDVVGYGDRVLNAVDLTSTVTIGNSGANQTWNFANLNVDDTDTLDFTNPAWIGLDNPFNSQMVVRSSRDDSSYSYLTKTSTYLMLDGIKQVLGNGDTSNIPFNAVLIPFPATYGISGSWTSNFTIATVAVGFDPDGPGPHPYVDSLRLTRADSSITNVDAWGDVTTPLGTFASLRQNNTSYGVDTLWMLAGGTWSVASATLTSLLQMDSISYDTTRTVRWWSNDPSARFPVVEFTYDQSGNSNGEIKWLKASPTTSIKEWSNNFVVSMFPNPSEGTITITAKEELSGVKIFDITGKMVRQYLFENQNQISINTNLPAGIYLVEISNRSGQKKIQKLTIR